MIFASSAVSQVSVGLDIDAQLYFLATILVVSLMLAPFVSALSLKISSQSGFQKKSYFSLF
jgi:heme exporter protein B